MHYINITMRNVVKIFHKNTVPSNGSGVGGSGMLDEEEIMKLYTAFSQGFLDFLFLGAEVGALGSLGALKPSTHPVMAIFLYPLGAEVEASCALEVKVEATYLEGALAVEMKETCLVGALDLMKVQATCHV
ncbi:hypothetical protein Tco_1239247 [Tanacetum coccineum]